MKVTIDGKVHEIQVSDLELDDNQVIVDKSNPPSGLFTQEALDEKIKQRLAKEPDKIKGSLKDDRDFHKEILSQYNVSLDENGQPKGLKPDFDPEEWKREKVKELTQPYESKLSEKEKKLNSFKKGLIRAEIMKSASSLFQEQYTKSILDDDPYVVKQFSDRFDVDDNGNVLLTDKDGGFFVANDGTNVNPSRFFEMNSDKFDGLLRDNRQKGSGFQNGSSGSGEAFTRQQLKDMSDSEYESKRDAIQKAQSEGRIK